MGHLKPANRHRKAPRWTPHCDTLPSVVRRRGEGIARGAPRYSTVLQRERYMTHRPGHHFRSSGGRDLRSARGGQISSHDYVDTQQTPTPMNNRTRHRLSWTSLARSHEHLETPFVLYCSKGSLEATSSHWVSHVQRQLFRLELTKDSGDGS